MHSYSIDAGGCLELLLDMEQAVGEVEVGRKQLDDECIHLAVVFIQDMCSVWSTLDINAVNHFLSEIEEHEQWGGGWGPYMTLIRDAALRSAFCDALLCVVASSVEDYDTPVL